MIQFAWLAPAVSSLLSLILLSLILLAVARPHPIFMHFLSVLLIVFVIVRAFVCGHRLSLVRKSLGLEPLTESESAVAGVIISASSGIDLLRGSGPGPGHQQAKHESRP